MGNPRMKSFNHLKELLSSHCKDFLKIHFSLENHIVVEKIFVRNLVASLKKMTKNIDFSTYFLDINCHTV